MKKKPKVKRMEKATVTLWLPNADGYPEPTPVEKYLWMCCECGLVWATREDAMKCAERGHKPYYIKGYGGAVVNGVYKPKFIARIHAIRREKVEVEGK